MTHFPNQDAADNTALRDVIAQVAKTLQSRGEGPTDGALLARIAGTIGRATDSTADAAGKDIPTGDESTQLEQLRARVAAQEAALHDALTRVVATEKLRTERDLAQARIANLETAARSAAVLLRSAATLSDTGQQLDPDTLRLAATCLDEATGTTPDPTEGGERP